MWRTILLGKLTISIVASFVVGGICVAHANDVDLSVVQAARWTGLGIFFLLLGVSQLAVIYLLHRKR